MNEMSALPDWMGKEFPEFTDKLFNTVREGDSAATELFCQRTWKLAFEVATALLVSSVVQEPGGRRRILLRLS
jgi:hypothetical protein